MCRGHQPLDQLEKGVRQQQAAGGDAGASLAAGLLEEAITAQPDYTAIPPPAPAPAAQLLALNGASPITEPAYGAQRPSRPARLKSAIPSPPTDTLDFG